MVQVQVGEGELANIEGKERVEQELFSRIHHKRFYLGERAPICQGRLRGEFGYMANTRVAKGVIEGKYLFREGFDDMTKEIPEECAEIWRLIPDGSVSNYLSHLDWQRRWLTIREKTFRHCPS